MKVHLVDGTYELFRHHFARPSHVTAAGQEIAATRGVLDSVLYLLAGGATHVGVATDHVIESFRNDLWPTYKSSAGMPPELLSQFGLLEDGLAAMGVTVWPMVELEADDALASAAHLASLDDEVEKVCIWTPDKDLAQCVVGDRVVQIDRKSGQIRDDAGVMAKFGVEPRFIADYLALVGDAADGYPGIAGCGAKTAARLIARHGAIEDFPPEVLSANRANALLFKKLATLRIDAPLFDDVDELRWRGPEKTFEPMMEKMGDTRLAGKVKDLASKLS
jgi:5'-3' exonuclease